MSQKRDGFEYKTLQMYQIEQAQKPQKRIPENPIHVARMYLREREGDQPKTYEQIAKQFGVSKVEVCYHIGLVNRLPEEFVVWLEQQEESGILKIFTERRLRSITRMSDQVEQWMSLHKILSSSFQGRSLDLDWFLDSNITLAGNREISAGFRKQDNSN
jgi:AraC-like DNA-binding protein